jgi:NADH-quinone oxidoreductase subunit K
LLTQLLVISLFLYFFGIFGMIFNQKNFLVTMLFIEVSYVGLFLGYICASLFLNNPVGQIYALVLLIIVACESAIGLGILLILYKNENTISFNDFCRLRG